MHAAIQATERLLLANMDNFRNDQLSGLDVLLNTQLQVSAGWPGWVACTCDEVHRKLRKRRREQWPACWVAHHPDESKRRAWLRFLLSIRCDGFQADPPITRIRGSGTATGRLLLLSPTTGENLQTVPVMYSQKYSGSFYCENGYGDSDYEDMAQTFRIGDCAMDDDGVYGLPSLIELLARHGLDTSDCFAFGRFCM